MMKLDDLSDAPLPNRSEPSVKARDFLDELTELLDDAAFSWAWDTIGGIRATVERTGTTTPGQYIAIRNIRASVEERASRPRWGRRYEGR